MNSAEQSEFSQNETIISFGRWNDVVSWKFIVSAQEIDPLLCTAACCVVTHNHKLLLVKNNRGWELPAGKIEKGESATETAIREVLEETTAIIEQPIQFGFKKITAIEPVPRSGSNHEFFPFPDSYVIFFYAVSIHFIQQATKADIIEKKLADYSEAKSLLDTGKQYEGIIEYLFAQKLIELD